MFVFGFVSARRAFAACCLAIALCAAAPVPDLPQVSSTWARATAPGQTAGAIYLTLTGRHADRLVGASSPDADAVTLHRSTEAGGMAGMEPVDGLDLATGQPVTLAPHGLHLMMTGLKHPLAAGSYITVALTFKQSGSATYNVPVVPIGATGPGAAHD